MTQPLPQIAAVSDMRLHQTEIIKKAKQAPVILMERGSKPALVCVLPEMWDALAKYIDDLECTVLARHGAKPRISQRSARRRWQQGDLDRH